MSDIPDPDQKSLRVVSRVSKGLGSPGFRELNEGFREFRVHIVSGAAVETLELNNHARKTMLPTP